MKIPIFCNLNVYFRNSNTWSPCSKTVMSGSEAAKTIIVDPQKLDYIITIIIIIVILFNQCGEVEVLVLNVAVTFDTNREWERWVIEEKHWSMMEGSHPDSRSPYLCLLYTINFQHKRIYMVKVVRHHDCLKFKLASQWKCQSHIYIHLIKSKNLSSVLDIWDFCLLQASPS